MHMVAKNYEETVIFVLVWEEPYDKSMVSKE